MRAAIYTLSDENHDVKYYYQGGHFYMNMKILAFSLTCIKIHWPNEKKGMLQSGCFNYRVFNEMFMKTEKLEEDFQFTRLFPDFLGKN